MAKNAKSSSGPTVNGHAYPIEDHSYDVVVIGAAGADHHHVVAVILDRIGVTVDCRSAARFCILRHDFLNPERKLEDGESGGESDGKHEERIGHQGHQLQ